MERDPQFERIVTTIDDYDTVVKLMDKMQPLLPIPAYPTPELVRTLRQNGIKISTSRPLFIKHLFYHGDVGGISCEVTLTPGGTGTNEAKEAIVVSLTHLRMAPGHPLYHDIRAYQRERVRRIAKAGH